MASQRPSNPVRSWREILFSPFVRVTVPPSCQAHSSVLVPNVSSEGFPLTITWNRPGLSVLPQGLVQSLVRTQRRYSPASGASKTVSASATGLPSPWAIRYGDPIWDTLWLSLVQPPIFPKPSASRNMLWAGRDSGRSKAANINTLGILIRLVLILVCIII